jgi:hypothetical protein
MGFAQKYKRSGKEQLTLFTSEPRTGGVLIASQILQQLDVFPSAI